MASFGSDLRPDNGRELTRSIVTTVFKGMVKSDSIPCDAGVAQPPLTIVRRLPGQNAGSTLAYRYSQYLPGGCFSGFGTMVRQTRLRTLA